jgi:hypothetical protein
LELFSDYLFRRKTFLDKVFPAKVLGKILSGKKIINLRCKEFSFSLSLHDFVGNKLLFKFLGFMVIYCERIELIPRFIAEKLVGKGDNAILRVLYPLLLFLI